MKAFNFKKWNLITGWIIFGISLLTYWLTVEPTASFWDPGEFITTSSNLEIGHPPGAPLFQLIGAVFSIFALKSTQIALMVNLTSVFSSAFRSEEHTSELQSRFDLVCRLLLEKKNKKFNMMFL